MRQAFSANPNVNVTLPHSLNPDSMRNNESHPFAKTYSTIKSPLFP
ncbi:hypothetical protein BH18THE2_BH18THE2_24530 [soil metagenome]